MDQPLGFAIGNALEVKEAIDTLKGNGPKDLEELVLEIGSQMVILGKKAKSVEEAKKLLREDLTNGKALNKLKELVEAQGGDSSIIDNEYLHSTKNIFIIVKTKIEINNIDISILNYVPPYTMLKLNLFYIIA